ncbi:MAG: pyridoxamine 5'-phosphate oxidase family protein [bacterium]|nr:pyridoxamine 5'-phosphate oxidase family protein [bacterium]
MTDSDQERARTDALAFLKRHKTGVLSTVSAQGDARSRLVHYVCDEQFHLYFSTPASTRKVADLAGHPQASFVVATEEVPQTIQLEGIVAEITDKQKLHRELSPLVEVVMPNSTFYWPTLKLDQGERKLMELVPTWIRWADYAFAEKGTEHVFKEIPVKP